jgi:hypothetical protein
MTNEHYNLGVEHASAKLQRYKFQDPYLQQQYDMGYDEECRQSGWRPDQSPRSRPDLIKYWDAQQIPGMPGRGKVW